IGLQTAGISLIRIDVNFQFESRVHADQHLIKSHSARAANLQLHFIPAFDSIKVSVSRRHVHMAQRADYPLLHFKKSRWSHEHATQGPIDISGKSKRQVKSKGDAISVRQLYLIQVSAWP